ncbi:MAG: hypothetical protein OEU92_29315 [Alphaproteobacteria bacterium]|nr:hypothetical protein [Alphaproteobacteria bacterium]
MVMLDRPDAPHWPTLLRPLCDASSALGKLAHALETTPLHPAWLWRETALVAARIGQFSGYRVRSDRLMRSLAGVPLDAAEDDTGLAAARRIFLAAAPLFRAHQQLDSPGSNLELFEPLWADHRSDSGMPAEGPGMAAGDAAQVERPGEIDQLLSLVRELAGFAGLETRPPLLDLFMEFRRHRTPRQLPPSLARLALPLALHRTGLAPKAAPGLLGGRLPLAAASPVATLAPLAATEGEPVTPWLARGLSALAREAEGSKRRLSALTRQHSAWRALLGDAGLRGHSRSPLVLDLLAATPVLSASLVARHLGCSMVGASKILHRLADLGIVNEATPRPRWKIYLAGDLALSEGVHDEAVRPLAFSEPAPAVDREAIEASLDELLRDLDRVERRAQAALAGGGG